MDLKSVKKVVEGLKSNKRNFSQSYDLIIALKEINLKKPEEQVEFFFQLPHNNGRVKKICGLVGPELADEAKKHLDTVILLVDFPKLDKKKIKKLASEHDFFVGQANIMPKIAQTFGRVLGPRGKMPNPKAGCIVPPKADLSALRERLQKTIKISVKKQPNIQVMVGKQNMDSEIVAQNIMSVYDHVIHHLPKEKNNIKSIYLKLTMSKPVKL